MKITFALAVLLLLAIIGYVEKQYTKPTAPSSAITSSQHTTVIPATITKEQAAAIISELPEIIAWSSYIERITQGKVHGMIMDTSEEPTSIDGKQYWPVDFYESQPPQIHRWESFLVSLDSKDILVDDIADGAISLQEWRDHKKPMAQIQ
ncbi:MAG: hypothetical protein EPN17_08825 [Methylobacter sp.]|nr:MAG: hypothetical protein EPN17_08825 [Methylobacter sp.]